MCFEILKLYFIVTLLYTEVNPEIQTESTKTLHQEVKTMKKLSSTAKLTRAELLSVLTGGFSPVLR